MILVRDVQNYASRKKQETETDAPLLLELELELELRVDVIYRSRLVKVINMMRI